MMLSAPFVWLAWSIVVPGVLADKDSRYYPPGISNPNVNTPYYWKNSLNVMQDLNQFSALYVIYTGCVWSRYGFGDGCSDVGQANQDDDEQANENYWYLGRTMCFRSNAAYVLYGTLKGHKDNGCHKANYIKSFFTEWGPESFAAPLGVDSSEATSECMDGEERQRRLLQRSLEGDDRWNFQDDDEWKKEHEYPFYDVTQETSYATGCSADGKFVTQRFNGGVCDGKQEQVIVDYLEDFNEELESLGCTLIYNASEEVSYNEDGEEAECHQEEDGTELCFDSPLGIIMNSQACLLDQYPNVCPDPYGTLAKYTRLLNIATGRAPVDLANARLKNFAASIMTAFGILFLALAAFVRTKRSRTIGDGDGVLIEKPLAADDPRNLDRQWEELDKNAPASPLMRFASDVSSTASSVFKAATEIEPDNASESENEVPYEPPHIPSDDTATAVADTASESPARTSIASPVRWPASLSPSRFNTASAPSTPANTAPAPSTPANTSPRPPSQATVAPQTSTKKTKGLRGWLGRATQTKRDDRKAEI